MATLITLTTTSSFATSSQPIKQESEPPSPVREEMTLQIKEETPQDIIRRYSALWNEEVEEIALAIALVESEYNPNAKNPNSTAKGIFQFLDGTWEEKCEGDPLNAEDNIKCGVELIGKKEIWRWESSQDKWSPLLSPTLQAKIREECSCVVYAQSRGLAVSGNADDILPNSPPIVGGGILFQYPQAGHIALIRNITDTGFIIEESNYKRCKKTERLVDFNDKYIRGFIN